MLHRTKVHHQFHFLLQVLLAFGSVAAVMWVISLVRPLAQPKVLPERTDLDLRADPVVLWCGVAVIAGVALFFLKFW